MVDYLVLLLFKNRNSATIKVERHNNDVAMCIEYHEAFASRRLQLLKSKRG